MRLNKDENFQEWVEKSNDKYLLWEIIWGAFWTFMMILWPIVGVILIVSWNDIKPYMIDISRGFIIGIGTLPPMLYISIKIFDYRYKNKNNKRHSK